MLLAGHVDLLSLSQNRDRQSGLPSWVPDWSDKIVRPSGQLPSDTFFAASAAQPFTPASNEISADLESVTLKGYLVDIIENLILGWTPRDNYMSEDLPQLGKYLQDIRDLCERSNAKVRNTQFEIYTNASDRAGAHIRIPIADQELNVNQFGAGGTQRATQVSHLRYKNLLDHIDGKLDTPSGSAG